jgi:hypothetical protein
VVPQIDCGSPPDTVVRWLTGSSDKPKDPVVWRSDRTFDPIEDYKLDMRVSGRYLSYRVEVTGSEPFKFSGFDAEVVSYSHR